VYENAVVVVAASCCRSPEDSFLNPRTPTNCGPVVVAWTDDHEPKPLLQVQKVPRMGFHMSEGDKRRDPLDTRAWAFQEKILAKRLLNFTSGEVQWSCKSANYCECPKAWNRGPADWNDAPTPRPQIVPATTRDWKKAITNFSALSLTYPSDKLPALSGLATRFQQKHEVNYLAGLWHNDGLAEQLAWFREHNQIYRAPTFSWASTNAKVSWHVSMLYFESYIEVLDAQCTLKNKNSFGEVLDGHMTVQGRLVRLMLQQPTTKEAHPTLCFINGDDVGLFFYLDKHAENSYFRNCATPAHNQPRLARSIQWLKEATDDVPKSIPIYCLRIFASGPWMKQNFLLLIKSSRVPGAYERIGLISAGGRLASDELMEKLDKLLKCWEAASIEKLIIV
jgi:hypothetical protein